MTITPTTPAPAMPSAGVAPGPGGAAGQAVPGDFLAMIQQALAGTPAISAPADSPHQTDRGADTDPAAADLALALGLVAPVSVPGLPTGVLTGTQVAGGAPASAAGANVTEESKAMLIGVSGNICPPGERPTNPIATTAAAAPTPAAQPATAPTGGDAHPTAATETDAPGTPPAGAPAHDDSHSPTDQPGAGQGQPAPSALPPTPGATPGPTPQLTSGPAPVAATPAATATAPTGAAAHVTGQVFPEVTALTTRGNGTHRITITLNPEALGEVRVVMTVRDGSVHVRLAAGHDAQQALLTGSPELTRLLEHAGAVDSRIVVRDLPAGSGSAPGFTADLGAGTGQSHDQHAGTRADHPATDGTNDGTTRTIRATTGANPPRSIEPVTDTRSAGVDVTM